MRTYIVSKRKHELFKKQRKNINFINRLKYAEQKNFCICVIVYKIYAVINMKKFIKFYPHKNIKN